MPGSQLLIQVIGDTEPVNVKNAILLFTILSASRRDFVVVCLFLFYPHPPTPKSCFTEVCLFFGGYMTEIV